MAVETSKNPLCFVLMPFGAKRDPTTGAEINFDDIYEKAIRLTGSNVGGGAISPAFGMPDLASLGLLQP